MHQVLLAAILCTFGAEPSVDIELLTERGVSMDMPQKWIETMKAVPNATLRIRSASGDERETVENRGTESAPRYHVVGLLTARNRLRLPGAEFSPGDRTAISTWFEKLRAEGPRQPDEGTAAFGLSSEQLVKFHDLLAKPVDFATKGQRAGDMARQMVKSTEMPFEVTAEAKAAFARNETVEDELQGLTCGTALAAVLRPLGLVFAPRRNGPKTLQLVIAETRQLEEFWPVGWPAQDSPYKVAPTLYEKLNVEIKDTALTEALTVIQGRVKIPFLYDQNSMARLGVNLDEIKVSYPKGRALYRKIVDQILFQARLNSELRVDEAGTPFLWITGGSHG